MDSRLPGTDISPRTLAAFAVHVFTACGAACALLALVAATKADWTQMFVWLGLALIVDGVDGTFARRLRVAELLPRWSGDVLDFVVDFATYVFVPAYAIAAGGVLPSSVALPLGLIVAVTGAIYFGDRRMKTSDSYFRGFPALWNIVAFYLFLLKPAPWLAALAVLYWRRRHSRRSISSTRFVCRAGGSPISWRWCCGRCSRSWRWRKVSIRRPGPPLYSPPSPSIS